MPGFFFLFSTIPQRPAKCKSDWKEDRIHVYIEKGSLTSGASGKGPMRPSDAIHGQEAGFVLGSFGRRTKVAAAADGFDSLVIIDTFKAPFHPVCGRKE